MRQRIVALVTASVLAIAGCSLNGGDDDTSDNKEPKGAFHFASGDLELGKFKKNSDLALFDPCAEISDEEFESIGYRKAEQQRDWPANSALVGCQIQNDDSETATIWASKATTDTFRSMGSDFIDSTSPVPGALIRKDTQTSHSCAAVVDTTRGVIEVSVGTIDRDVPIDDLCDTADQIIGGLWQLGRS